MMMTVLKLCLHDMQAGSSKQYVYVMNSWCMDDGMYVLMALPRSMMAAPVLLGPDCAA
jgi:hypothetical protein